MPTDSALFDSGFLAKLERLHLIVRRRFRGHHRAGRRSHRPGASLEFADHRNYTPGDDLRSIDWNIYGRLDRLFVKLFEEERDLDVHFLIDISRSMLWPPAAALTKLDQARRISAALAYIALAGLDRVNILYFDGSLRADLGLARGKSQFHKVLDFLRHPPDPSAPTDLARAMHDFARRLKRRGLVFVLSDFLDARGYETGLAVLRHSQFEIQVIHLVDPAEEQPAVRGDLRLVEVETGTTLDVTADPPSVRRYRQAFAQFTAGLDRYCLERGIGCVHAPTTDPFDEVVLQTLRERRMVK